MQPKGGVGGLSLPLVGRLLRKNAIWILALTVVGVGVAAFVALSRTKFYRTTASVLIDPSPPRPLGKDVMSAVDVSAGAYWTNKEYYETQFQLIRSRRIATETVRTLGLERDAAFLAGRPAGSVAGERQVDSDVAAGVLASRLAVEPVKGTRLVTISYEDADPERARRVLSAHVALFVQQNLDDALASTGTTADWMKDQLGRLRTELETSELALHEYKKEKRILSVSLDDQNNMLRDEMKALNDELTRVRAERERLASRVAELDKIDTRDPEDLPASELLANPLLTKLRENYIEAKRDRDAQLGGGRAARHPDVLAAAAKIATTRAALLAEVKNVKEALRRDLSGVGRQAGGLSKLFEAAKQRALDINLLEIEYRRLERNKNNTERLFSLLLERSKDSDLTRQMRFNNIRVVDAPLTPKSPVRPNVPLSLAVGLLAGLGLGVAFALGRELLDRTLKSPDDVRDVLGLTYLGLLPRTGEGAREGRRARRRAPSSEPPELTVHAKPKSGTAEAARAIRTNLMFMSPDQPPRRLLVTSAVPSEGKTTVACSVAIAMAQAGQRVLLLDCDLRRPRLHKVFSAPSHLGVSNAVLDLQSLDEALVSTEVPNLTLLPAGALPPTPAELLHSAAFGRLLDTLSERFDRVVIDSPPLVPVTDAAIIATRVDGVILVARPLRTRRDLAGHAIRALRDVGARVLGCILNDVNIDERGYDYYYYYAPYYTAPARDSALSTD